MPRVLSGIRATGGLHLGNYLGAIRQWLTLQAEADCFFFIADLHGLTDLGPDHEPNEFRMQRAQTAAAFIASGIDSSKATLFMQSAIPQHVELMWYLSSVARKSELERMVQWKEKSTGAQVSASASLFAYPTLMAADILLYDADEVPVGDDQRQHVEVTRDWAERFNSYFGPTFKIPAPVISAHAARIMDLQQPSNKMSKSSASTAGVLFLDDTPDALRQKIASATTDADRAIRRSSTKPGISNLIEIYAALSGLSQEDVEAKFDGASYSNLKSELADLVITTLEPVRHRMHELIADPAELDRLVTRGAAAASQIAEKTCARAREALGLGPLS